MDRNVVVGLVLGAAAVLAVGGLLALSGLGTEGTGDVVEAHVEVTDRHDGLLHAMRVEGRNLTVLELLDRASAAGGFPYRAETYPGMGAYVASINGTEAEGSSGWVYRVLRKGSWCWGDRAPDRAHVEDGDRVVWEWTEDVGAGGCWDAS